MARRGFYEDYIKAKTQNQTEHTERPAMIRRSFGTAVFEFLAKLFTAVLYLCVIFLSSVGLTTLINRPLRDMLFEIIQNMFF